MAPIGDGTSKPSLKAKSTSAEQAVNACSFMFLVKQIMQEPSGASLNQQIKANSPQQRKRKSKEVSKRQSLAGAGTLWQSGVRRSTRIKTRPLEFWKGERLLFGRIHESLPTVIGMKYASPGKGDGKAPLKVKSFVSDKYKELVELAALH